MDAGVTLKSLAARAVLNCGTEFRTRLPARLVSYVEAMDFNSSSICNLGTEEETRDDEAPPAEKKSREREAPRAFREHVVVFWNEKSPEIPGMFEIDDHEQDILDRINVHQGFFEDLKCKFKAVRLISVMKYYNYAYALQFRSFL